MVLSEKMLRENWPENDSVASSNLTISMALRQVREDSCLIKGLRLGGLDDVGTVDSFVKHLEKKYDNHVPEAVYSSVEICIIVLDYGMRNDSPRFDEIEDYSILRSSYRTFLEKEKMLENISKEFSDKTE